MSGTVLENLLGAIRLGIPDLSRGLCLYQWDLFDASATDVDAAEKCQELCAICPVLTRCREYVDSLVPSKRPPGVTAGQLNTYTPRKKVSA